MKRFRVLLLVMAALLTLPSSGLAQGFFNALTPGSLAGLPLPFSSSSLCRSDTSSALAGGPILYFGWTESPNGSSWAIQHQLWKGTATLPLRGAWFGATKEVDFDNGYGFLISGSIFVPRRVEGGWFPDPSGNSVAFEIPSYDWWNVDGLVKARVPGNFEVLAGFRWDHTSARVNYSDNTSDDYILNSYIPLIGTQVCQPYSGCKVLVRVLYSPLVFGSMRYHYWDRAGFSESGDFPLNRKSSFLEVLADYRIKLAGNLQVGCFAKWNWLRVRTEERNLSGSTAEPISWGVDIRSWTVGGDVSLAFSFPL